jgi:hypothetical protein
MDNADSFDHFDFSEFSSEDLLCIDDSIADVYTMHESGLHLNGEVAQASAQINPINGGPRLQIEVDEPFSDQAFHVLSRTLQEPQQNSLYMLYRAKKNVLSVTDLTAPQWSVFC